MSISGERRGVVARLCASIAKRPRFWFFGAAVVVAALGAGLGGVRKDPSVDAFVPDDHPAAAARDRAEEVFGLEDPLIIGLAVEEGGSAFTPAVLDALRRIETEIAALPNIDASGLMSVATESAMSAADAGDLSVDPILPPGPVTPKTAALAWERLRSMPMFVGLLASETGDTVTLIAPVHDPNRAEETYAAVRRIADNAAPAGVDAHVAGVAAMNGRLAVMVTTDTRIFVPAAAVVALLFLYVALRRGPALLGPVAVIAGSTAAALGIMGWLGAKYYLITTALPVIIMAIAIADALHISTLYLKERSDDPNLDVEGALQAALQHTALPVTLTSLTTVAGFAGLALGSPMRPISEFGWFATVGVAAAWALSLTALPAVIVMTRLEPRGGSKRAEGGIVDLAIARLTQVAFQRPKTAAALLVALVAVLAVFATQASFDYERKRYFVEDDPVRISDALLNERLNGLNFLDVVVTAPDGADLMTPEAIMAIRRLTEELRAEPLVSKTTGIDDYMALMHEILTNAPQGALPTTARAPAQYMLLYEASGDPGDFDRVVDYDYRNALVRTQLVTDRFRLARPVVDAYERAAEAFVADSGFTAQVSGRVAVNDGWMSLLAGSHFATLALALALVFVAAAASFRSLSAAALATVPVLTGVLFTYAVMGAFGVDIAPATSMTAAIATGLGVDFGVHLISHIRKSQAAGFELGAALSGRYAVIGRACLYSASALAVALCVICLSSAPPLRWFGALVAAAAIGSLAGALFILPAFYGLFSNRLSAVPKTAMEIS
ncbi:MAG: MMPL family transporter [Pseudomonadota bacterium]